MKKKNAFLEALENTDFGKIDMKGVSLGGDYSSVKSERIAASLGKLQKPKTDNPPNIDFKARLKDETTNTKDSAKNSLKSKIKQEKTQDTEQKPKRLRLKAKIIPQKPPNHAKIQPKTKDSHLSISLDFLKSMAYDQQVAYLALNGWSLHLERYQGIYSEVAQKYFDRRKYRVYLRELDQMPNYEDYSKTDMLKVQNMTSDLDKKIYLFKRGWSVKVLVRGFQEYEYAIRYFNRKKKMIYLGVHQGGDTKLFLT